MSEDKEEKQPQLIHLGDEYINPALINRLSVSEKQDIESPIGISYRLTVHMSFFPFQLEFGYATYELREKKKSWLLGLMKNSGIEIIEEPE